jgi:hypothetical protein
MKKHLILTSILVITLLLTALSISGFTSVSRAEGQASSGSLSIDNENRMFNEVNKKFTSAPFEKDNTVHQIRAQRIKHYLQLAESYEDQHFRMGSVHSVKAADRLLDHHIDTLQQRNQPRVVTYEIVEF